MPNDNCPLCVAIGDKLARDLSVVEGLYMAAEATPADVRAHALAAICSWWITATMKDPSLGPEAIVRCVANCLQLEHGVSGAAALTAVRLSRIT
jgi:hypothetical protein